MTMAPKLTIPPLRNCSSIPQQQDDRRLPTAMFHRGKKAAIVQLVEDHDDEDDDQTVPVSPPRSAHTKDDHYEDLKNTPSSSKLKLTRARSIMERVVSNPVVSYFTCGKQSGEQEALDGSTNSSGGPFGWFRGKSQQQSFSTALQSGYPKAIVQTMKQFPYQGRIQRLGCGALRDLAVDSWPLKLSVVEAKSVETILKAMRIHLKDAKLQEIACACLYELVAGDLPALLVEKGVVTAILTTMDQHSQDEDVLPIACNVLMALTDRDVGAVECLRQRLGGVVLAKLEHSFRGRNAEITLKVGELLRRLYL
jgi:hypothetical protein